MTTAIHSSLDLLWNELLKLRFQNLAAAPADPQPGYAYFDTVLDTPRVRNTANNGWIDLVVSPEQIQDIIGAMLSGNTESGISVTYQDSDGTVDLAVTDSPLLEGQSLAQVIAAAVAAVVDTAPNTLDTLNELAAALGDDANFAATINAAIALRTKKFAQDIGDAAATSFNVDHNLNTLDVEVTIYKKSTGAKVLVDVANTTVNRVVVGPFSVAPGAAEFRVVVVG